MLFRTYASRPGLLALSWGSSSQSASAPKTGQHTVGDALRDEALALFFEDPASVRCTPTTGGVNNVVQYVDGPLGRVGVLRVYNNGLESEKVRFEHEILRQLQAQAMSFEVPRALPSRTGRPHELLSNGTEACVFKVIPGTLAKTTTPEEVGRASGELCTAMSKVSCARPCPRWAVHGHVQGELCTAMSKVSAWWRY